MLRQVLFQISSVADTSFISRLADQALSLALLALATYALWNQYRKLEARLTKYMEEDRKQMMDIINNNTKVMQQIKDHLDKL